MTDREVMDDNDFDDLEGGMHSEDTDRLMSDEDEPAKVPLSFFNCFSLAMYKPYFDVDTITVKERLKAFFMSPLQERSTFLDNYVHKKPDAYGPFWIATTLIFLIGVVSNFRTFQFHTDTEKAWVYDFQVIVSASSIVYGMLVFVPLGYYFLLKRCQVHIGLTQLMCLYGYSMLSFIPGVLLCAVPYSAFAWVVYSAALALSLVFLAKNLIPIVTESNPAQSSVLLGSAACVHAFMFLLLKFLYL